MSNRSTPLQALIDAYARAKGVILPASDMTNNADIFIQIYKTVKGQTVDITTSYPSNSIITTNIIGKPFNFLPNIYVEVLNTQKNPRIVGSVRAQIDGKTVRFFDATNTEVDTIYTAKSEKNYNDLCADFGIPMRLDIDACTMILAQCENDSFGDQCKTTIKGNTILVFNEKEKDTKTLLQAFAFLQKLGWKHDIKTYVLETAEEWVARQTEKTIIDLSKRFLNNIVTALNASDVPKQLLNKSNGSSPVDNLDEIKAALAEGRFSVERFLTPYGLFGYPFMRGGANAKASEKFAAQYKKLQDILKSDKKQLDTTTESAISTEMNNLQKAESDIDKANLSLTNNLDLAAKEIVAKREDLKDSNGQPITSVTKVNLDEFIKAYEKLHVSVGKISNAFTNAYILLGKFARKASDVTAEKIAAAAPSRKVMAFI